MRPFTLRTLALLFLLSVVACTSSRVRTDVTLEELQAAAARDSADAIAQYNLAIGHWSQENFTEARDALQRAVRIDPRFAEGYLALAYLPYAQRPQLWREVFEDRVPEEWQDALIESERHYGHAFMINPLVDMRILGAVTPMGGFSTYYDAFFRGFEDYRNGNYEAAYGRYDRLIRELEIEWRQDARARMPDAILLHRGLAAAHLGNWDVAVGDLQIIYDRHLDVEREYEGLVHVPLQTNHYRYILAVLQEGAGHHAEAQSLLYEAATEDLGLYMAHVRLANIAEARGDAQTALSERQLAVDANPEDPTVHLEQGLTYANVRMYAQSIASLDTAIRLNPLDAQAHYFLGVVHEMAGNAQASRSALERFVAIAPARMAQERADAETRLGSR